MLKRYKTIIVSRAYEYSIVFSESYLDRLSREVDLISPFVDSQEINQKKDLLSQVELIVGTWGMPLLDKELLDQMPHLQGVFYAAGTVKYFLSEEFWRRKITLCAAADANSIPVAEMTFAQIILGLKKYWHYTIRLQGGKKYTESRDCFGCYRSRVGLISLGSIGRRVLERLKTLEVDVLVYDPYLDAIKAKEYGVTLVSLEQLFEQSDIVSLHAPWLKETEKMIREKHFLAMKSGATFINTSRGAIVDEEGMIRALQKREDLWAILDVTHPEPPIDGSALYTLPNVLLSPHIAGSLSNECHRMADWMLEEIQSFQKGDPLRYQILESQLARMA